MEHRKVTRELADPGTAQTQRNTPSLPQAKGGLQFLAGPEHQGPAVRERWATREAETLAVRDRGGTPCVTNRWRRAAGCHVSARW